MNLTPLFKKQAELQEHILATHPELAGVDLLPEKILALQVELGELANEWRGFKFWSNDREPRTRAIVDVFKPGWHGPSQRIANRVLEEYVDCLHFGIGIGLHDKHHEYFILEYQQYTLTRYLNFHRTVNKSDITRWFTQLMGAATDYASFRTQENYYDLMFGLLRLGEMLGFSWEQIEQAYMEKNAVNHERQEAGY